MICADAAAVVASLAAGRFDRIAAVGDAAFICADTVAVDAGLAAGRGDVGIRILNCYITVRVDAIAGVIFYGITITAAGGDGGTLNCDITARVDAIAGVTITAAGGDGGTLNCDITDRVDAMAGVTTFTNIAAADRQSSAAAYGDVAVRINAAASPGNSIGAHQLNLQVAGGGDGNGTIILIVYDCRTVERQSLAVPLDVPSACVGIKIFIKYWVNFTRCRVRRGVDRMFLTARHIIFAD